MRLPLEAGAKVTGSVSLFQTPAPTFFLRPPSEEEQVRNSRPVYSKQKKTARWWPKGWQRPAPRVGLGVQKWGLFPNFPTLPRKKLVQGRCELLLFAVRQLFSDGKKFARLQKKLSRLS